MTRLFVVPLSILLAAMIVSGCTRNRAESEPTVTAEAQAGSVESIPSNSGEPGVTTATPVPQDEPTSAPDPEETSQESDDKPEIFQYTVQQGDMISSIAEKFGTDIATIRQLNFLQTDNILVGQVLRIPLGDGYSQEGPPTPTPNTFRYSVQAGDTLAGIAAEFDVDYAALIQTNNILDPNDLRAGQELIIPGYKPATASVIVNNTPRPAQPSAADTPQVVHVVQPGEGLYAIADKYGVEAAAIAEANNIQNWNLLRPGQKLFIPGITVRQAAAANQSIHIVKAGESLYGIAALYNVEAQEIATLNNIQNTDLLYQGQELIIPSQ